MILKSVVYTAILAIAGSAVGASAEEAAKAKILFFTKSAGFEHSTIKRKGDDPSFAGKILRDLGAKHNFEVVESKDGSLFNATYLAGFDAYFFYTTGVLTTADGDKNPAMSVEGKQALFDAIKGGKGFLGTHSATDTFHPPGSERYHDDGDKVDPYCTMIGAEFIHHGAQQKAKLTNVDPTFPGLTDLKDGITVQEEWYSLKNFSKDLHVLLVQETGDMKGNMYQRGPYPETWIHNYGKGRVFYTSLGHREDVWTNPAFQGLLIGGIDFALGRVKADTTPNIDKVTPKYAEIPPAK